MIHVYMYGTCTDIWFDVYGKCTWAKISIPYMDPVTMLNQPSYMQHTDSSKRDDGCSSKLTNEKSLGGFSMMFAIVYPGSPEQVQVYKHYFVLDLFFRWFFTDCNMVNHHRTTIWENSMFFQASCANPSSFALFCWIVRRFRSGFSL